MKQKKSSVTYFFLIYFFNRISKDFSHAYANIKDLNGPDSMPTHQS